MNLKLPSKANPTGTYRLYLSKPWERLAAARLAKVQCEEGIEPIATIRPNLAQSDQKGEPFDIVVSSPHTLYTYAKNATTAWNLPIPSTRILG